MSATPGPCGAQSVTTVPDNGPSTGQAAEDCRSTVHGQAPASDPGQSPRRLDAPLAAVMFLTRLPVSLASAPSPQLWRRSLIYFPLVGAGAGAAGAAVLLASGLIWPLLLAVLLALVIEIVLTGGLHEDGLADCCDGFGGGGDRQAVLTIMKDSRVGTFGVLGLLAVLSLKVTGIHDAVTATGLDQWWRWGSMLVAAAAIGRWALVWTLAVLPPLDGRQSLTQHYQIHLGSREFISSTLWVIAAVLPHAIFQPLPCLAGSGLALAGVWAMQRYVLRRLGGVSGDCLGAIGCIAPVLVILGSLAGTP